MIGHFNHAFISHTATAYPFAKETASFLFVDGAAYPYADVTGGLTHDALVITPGDYQRRARDVLAYFHAGPSIAAQRTPVIAYGANANVDVLTRKFVTNPFYSGSGVVPVTQVTLRDLDVVWAAHFGRGGAIPATVAPSPNTQISAWITWLDDVQLLAMHDSETITDFYAYGSLTQKYVAASDADLDQDPTIYVDCYGALLNTQQLPTAVQGIPATGRSFPVSNAIEAMASVCETLGWDGSPYELILDNLRNPDSARDRNSALRSRAAFDHIVGFEAIIACAH